MAATILDGLASAAELRISMDAHAAEMQFHNLEILWRIKDENRRSLDEKAEQLKAVSEISALIAGFAMVTFVEVDIPDNLSESLLCISGMVTAVVIALMLYVMFSSILVLLEIYKENNRIQQEIDEELAQYFYNNDNIKNVTNNNNDGDNENDNNNHNNNKDNENNISSRSLRKNMDDLVNLKFPIQSIKFTLWFREKNGISWKNILTSFGIGICLFPILIGVTGWIVFWNHPSRDTAASLVTVISFILEMIVSYELYLSKDYLLDEPTTTVSNDNNNGGDDN